MKKFAALLLACALALTLASCRTPEPIASPSPTTPSVAPSETPSAEPSTEPTESVSHEPVVPADPTEAPSEAPAADVAEYEQSVREVWALVEGNSPLEAGSFFYLIGGAGDIIQESGATFLATDEAGVQHLLRAYVPAVQSSIIPTVESLAYTDEQGVWRSGYLGAGVDAETAAHYIAIVEELTENRDEFSHELPIADMEFVAGSGTVLCTVDKGLMKYTAAVAGGYRDSCIIHILATTPDMEEYDEPIELFYELTPPPVSDPTDSEFAYIYSVRLLAYDEGYGWSKIEG